MMRKAIIHAATLAACSIFLLLFVGLYHPAPKEPKDTRLAAPAGGFKHVITYYDDRARTWHIKYRGSEANK